ncbi:MAG: cadherin-like beta sandwich domain-containing protein, partial [Bacilli bacterium]|nr:cadherin-like beta sandwich domain-containing protein [Bacilli bacterium]
GTSTNYTITVNRQKHTEPEPEPTKSSDSSLKSLGMSGYSYSPKFNPSTLNYSMTVSNGIKGLYVQAVPNDPKATVDIEGDSKWDVGKNTVKITVTAEDGSKTVYKVVVNRESEKKKSSDKNVDFKIYSPHTIDPNFSNDKNDYNVTVPYDVKKLDLSVIPYDSNTKVEITGNEKFSTEGDNIVKIKVTAEDGSTKTITLKVKRSEYKANTDLLDLKVRDYEMSPVFKASTTNYKVTVPHKVRNVTVLVKAPKGATYKITGNKNLQVGNNVVLVKVTDEKDFTKYYQIDITRKKGFNIFGLGLIPFLIILFLLLILLLLLLLLLRRRKNKKERRAALIAKESSDDDVVKQEAPVHIDFKPEFNFNSKNGTDDDVVYANGPMLNGMDEKKLLDNQETVVDAKYDIYDDVVTKDELVDALNEGIRTKNVDKLQMLLDQENLNRKKKRMKKREEAREENESNDDDYEPEHSADNYDDYDEE